MSLPARCCTRLRTRSASLTGVPRTYGLAAEHDPEPGHRDRDLDELKELEALKEAAVQAGLPMHCRDLLWSPGTVQNEGDAEMIMDLGYEQALMSQIAPPATTKAKGKWEVVVGDRVFLVGVNEPHGVVGYAEIESQRGE